MAGQIEEFAARLLWSERLADKLQPPGDVIIDEPGGAALGRAPDAPGRPLELRFRKGAASAGENVFRAGDESDRGRGLLLHAFANHELLALELMALMLLRFPDAPSGLRRDLVRMIGEEQRHLSLYLERMRGLGVEFGEAPLNDFFWRLMSDLELPEFVAAMNLTFEQANLDHATTYRDYFARIGDCDSAEILETVLADEIGHVKGGLAWFRAMKPESEDDWSAYLRLLPRGLSPARARGQELNLAARRAAGLSEDFIERLAVFAGPKGHAARVFLFDPACDEAVGHGRTGLTLSAAVEGLRRDLETLPVVFASAEDVVLVSAEPSRTFLRELADAGFELPRFVPADDPALHGEKIAGLYPWGWSPDTRAALEPFFQRVVKEPGPLVAGMAGSGTPWLAVLGEVYSRAFDLRVCKRVHGDADIRARFASLLDDACIGQAVSSIEEINRRLASVPGRHVLKSPFSAAGRRRIFPEGRLSSSETRWVARQLSEFDILVLEPWLDRVLDLSFQGELLPNGEAVARGVTRFMTDSRGRYLASFVGGPFDDLSPALRRFLNGHGNKEKSVFRLLEGAGGVAADALREAGFRGPFAVDALVYRAAAAGPGDERFYCKPVVEVNPRYTMGRVARELSRRVRYGARSLFAILSSRDAGRAGFVDFPALVADARRRYPLELERSGRVNLIAAGFLPLADPERAGDFLPVLWCGRRDTPWPDIFAHLSGLGSGIH